MTNKALLCGINNYKSQTALRGCINDIERISLLLIENFDFQSSNIHKLTDDRVTKENIKKEWQWLLEGSKSGDYLVFHFSGHGSYVPDDEDDDDESDGYDEITCLYDMDFYNDRTFFRDDEWNQTIEQVPSGVKLTVIMDTCHSGTGTRMLSVNMDGRVQRMSINLKDASPKGKGREALRLLDVVNTASSELFTLERYSQLLREKNVVVNRFLAPPPELQERIFKTARSKRLTKPGIKKGTHLLLAACQDNQTSADAYIDGDFNGAFTYYFCQAIEQFPELGTKELIDRVTQQLETGGFTQKPQHEGENLPSPIFGKSLPIKIPKPTTMTSKNNISAENQKLLIEAYMKLLDTIGGTEEFETVGRREAGNCYLVYVHGISQHRTGYSEPWWKALKPHVGRVFGDGNLDDTRREVIWSDLVNERDIRSIDREKREQLRREIKEILEDRQRKEIAISSGGKRHNRQAIAPVIERGDGFAIDDFLIYMVDSQMRQRIIDRFTKIVVPLLNGDNEIDIISHSWGTVVAYEGLRELEQQSSLRGKVNNFFTVGSALSIPPVRGSLREENKQGSRPVFVENWFNLDAKGDLVGGLLGDRFEITQEFLELEPIECERGWFGYNLGCAHGSYFRENNLAVNRDIFARFINSHL
jgi:hypothetical protein